MFGPWGRWYPWYAPGFGWQAFGYDPWSYGATYWGWGRYGLWYDPYSYYWDPFWNSVTYGVGGAPAPKPRETIGSVRIKANPESAKVYIDGALVGTVDEFNGLTDHLELQGGRHVLELRAEGFQTATEEIVVAVGKTQTVRISMKKVK
jgi:hypothetical protein